MTESSFDHARFRQIMGHFPTGVTVVTAMTTGDGAGLPTGMAIGSFASVSLDPPLVMFCPTKDASTWREIEASKCFAVNVLRAEQEAVSRVFATKDVDKFSGLGWHKGATGSPILDDHLAYLDCTVHAIYEGGDHWVVLGKVVELGLGDEGLPLVFFRGGYGTFSA